MSSSRALLVAALLALVPACGFRLQTAFTPPADMARTHLVLVDERSDFSRALRRALGDAGLELVDDPALATASFTVSFDETDQRVLSVSARNVPTEYEVYYTVRYAIEAGSKVLLEEQTLTLTRDYTYDSTLVLGKAREQDLMREQLVRDLVRIVLKQIDTL